MRVNRKTLILILVIVVVLIASLTIVYAALSASLIISGSGKVNATEWDINITNSDNIAYVNSTTGSATFTTPVITGTTIANYTVSLTKPGDSVALYFRLSNDGDINGEISEVINSVPVCTSSTGNTADANLVCDNLDFSFSYFDGKALESGHILSEETVCFTDGADSGIDSILEVVVGLKSSMTAVPSSTITISNLKHEINFIQSDKECNPSSTGTAAPR